MKVLAYNNFLNLLLGFSLAMGLLVSSGCSDTRRQSIEGTVTFDDQPLPDGYIRLLPLPGTPGPAAGASVQNGHFAIDATKGTFAGRFQVEILASRHTSQMTIDQETGEKVPVRQQYIPARYNAESELTVDIVAGQENKLEYKLTSK